MNRTVLLVSLISASLVGLLVFLALGDASSGAVDRNSQTGGKADVQAAPLDVAQGRETSPLLPSLSTSASTGFPGATVVGNAPAAPQSQHVENWGDRVRSLAASSSPRELGEALGLISICRQQAEVRQSFDRYAARTAVDPKRLQAVAESLHQTEAACQTIGPEAFVDGQALALRFYESGSTGAAALVAREYPELAARLPRNDFYGQMKKDAYAGDESSIGLLAKSRAPGMAHDEYLGFQLALSALADGGAPSAGGQFGRLFREAVGAVSPEAQRVSAALLEAVAQARRKANGR